MLATPREPPDLNPLHRKVRHERGYARTGTLRSLRRSDPPQQQLGLCTDQDKSECVAARRRKRLGLPEPGEKTCEICGKPLRCDNKTGLCSTRGTSECSRVRKRMDRGAADRRAATSSPSSPVTPLACGPHWRSMTRSAGMSSAAASAAPRGASRPLTSSAARAGPADAARAERACETGHTLRLAQPSAMSRR